MYRKGCSARAVYAAAVLYWTKKALTHCRPLGNGVVAPLVLQHLQQMRRRLGRNDGQLQRFWVAARYGHVRPQSRQAQHQGAAERHVGVPAPRTQGVGLQGAVRLIGGMCISLRWVDGSNAGTSAQTTYNALELQAVLAGGATAAAGGLDLAAVGPYQGA